MRPEPVLRLARIDDVARLETLIEASVRTLQAQDYTSAQIERSLHLVFGVDRQLVLDGGYFVLADGDESVACGGWSFRRTLFGADAIHSRDDAELDPGVDAAKIRAFFVAPHWARRGLGGRLLAACEAAAYARGFRDLELGATLTGVPLYARYGFREVERISVPLAEGLDLAIVRMAKRLQTPPPPWPSALSPAPRRL
jgi:GNAT superfamily N-acetyltransferase